MTERLDSQVGLVTRRGFLTRAALVVGAAAALHTMTRNLPFSPFRGATGALHNPDSIFLPRSGSTLRYWRSRLDRFRLR